MSVPALAVPPTRAQACDLLIQYGHSEAARAVVTAEEHAIVSYERYKEHVSYGFYVARKVGE